MKTLLFILGSIFMPFFYLGFRLSGMYIPLSDLYRSFYQHYQSNEPFGPFDRS